MSAVTPAVGAEFSVVDAKTGRSYSGNLGAAAEWLLSGGGAPADFSAACRRLAAINCAWRACRIQHRSVIAGKSYEAVTRAAIRAYYFNRAGHRSLPEHASDFAAGRPP